MRSRRGARGPARPAGAPRPPRPEHTAPRLRRARASPPVLARARAECAAVLAGARARRTPGRVAAPPPRALDTAVCLLFTPFLRSFLLPERPGRSLAFIRPADLRAFRIPAPRDPPRNPRALGADVEANGRSGQRPSPARGANCVAPHGGVAKTSTKPGAPPRKRSKPRRRLDAPLRRLRRPDPFRRLLPSRRHRLLLAARLQLCSPKRRVGSRRPGGPPRRGRRRRVPVAGRRRRKSRASTEPAARLRTAPPPVPNRRDVARSRSSRARRRRAGRSRSSAAIGPSPASPAPRSAGSASANAARATRRRIQPTSTGPGSPFAKDSVGRSIGSVEGPSTGALPEVVVVPSPFASEARRDARRRSFHAPSSEKHSTLEPPPVFDDRATSPSATSPPPRLAPAASRLARLHGAAIAGGLVPDLAPETAYLFRLLAVVPRERAELFERASEREKESDSPKKNKNKHSPGGVNHSDTDASREYSPPPSSLLPRASALHLYAAEALAGCFDVACASGDALLHAARASPALLAADRGLARRFAERLARDREVSARDATRRLGVFFEGGGGEDPAEDPAGGYASSYAVAAFENSFEAFGGAFGGGGSNAFGGGLENGEPSSSSDAPSRWLPRGSSRVPGRNPRGFFGPILPAEMLAATAPLGAPPGTRVAGGQTAAFEAARNESYRNREKARDALLAELRALAGEASDPSASAAGGSGFGSREALRPPSVRARELVASVRPENIRWFAELVVARLAQAAAAGEADEELASAVTPARLARLHRRLTENAPPPTTASERRGESNVSNTRGGGGGERQHHAHAHAHARGGAADSGGEESRRARGRESTGPGRAAGGGGGGRGGGGGGSLSFGTAVERSFACLFPPSVRPYVRLVEAADSHVLATAMTRALVAALHALDPHARPEASRRRGGKPRNRNRGDASGEESSDASGSSSGSSSDASGSSRSDAASGSSRASASSGFASSDASLSDDASSGGSRSSPTSAAGPTERALSAAAVAGALGVRLRLRARRRRDPRGARRLRTRRRRLRERDLLRRRRVARRPPAWRGRPPLAPPIRRERRPPRHRAVGARVPALLRVGRGRVPRARGPRAARVASRRARLGAVTAVAATRSEEAGLDRRRLLERLRRKSRIRRIRRIPRARRLRLRARAPDSESGPGERPRLRRARHRRAVPRDAEARRGGEAEGRRRFLRRRAVRGEWSPRRRREQHSCVFDTAVFSTRLRRVFAAVRRRRRLTLERRRLR